MSCFVKARTCFLEMVFFMFLSWRTFFQQRWGGGFPQEGRLSAGESVHLAWARRLWKGDAPPPRNSSAEKGRSRRSDQDNGDEPSPPLLTDSHRSRAGWRWITAGTYVSRRKNLAASSPQRPPTSNPKVMSRYRGDSPNSEWVRSRSCSVAW